MTNPSGLRHIPLVLLCLAICVATPSASGGDRGTTSTPSSGLQLTPAELACMRKAIPAAQVAELVKTGDPSKLPAASLAKAEACHTSGGTSSTPVVFAKTGAWIVANPFSLAKVTEISAFRSCLGHDFSGDDIQGKPETDRSMKHYIQTSIPWNPPDTLKGVAPFAGQVSIHDESIPVGHQVWVVSPTLGWAFVYFHADPLVASGATVTAGEPVAAWPAKGALAGYEKAGAGAEPALEFDIALESADGSTLDSPLLHMTPRVAAIWAAKGFTPARAIVSKAARDAAPCNNDFNGHPGDWVAATAGSSSR
jgi:hypothetical protein